MKSLKLVFANSVDYARNTGGWVYNSRVVEGLQSLGWDVERLDLPAGFPRPDCDARITSNQLLVHLPDGALVVADQICWSPLAGIIAPEVDRLRFVMIFHHPIAMEEGLAEAERARFAALERKALAACRLVVATSQSTARTLAADYGVPAERVVVAQPGIERFDASVVRGADVLRMLSVGAVIARKGYHILIKALAGLHDLPWQLEIVGDLDRAPEYVAGLREMIRDDGLEGRVVLRGGIEPTALEACWRSTHVYVAASIHEGYGMAVAEAIARGLPTVTTRAGAIGDWLDPEAAIIVPDCAVGALRDGIEMALAVPELRAKLRRAARVQAARFPSWFDTARAVHERLAQV